MTTTKGFTLIELSIVLVIIGLIVTAIVGGRELIRQAELQNIVKEMNGYKTVWNAFKMKYDAWPGDFKDANQYWAGAHVGNGDKDLLNAVPIDEQYQVWEHLALAQLIPSTYTGRAQGSQPFGKIGVNLPSSRIKGATYFVWTPNNNAGCPGCTLYGKGGTGLAVLNFGGEHNDYQAEDPVVTPGEAKSIDVKIDDGIPNKGLFITRRAWLFDGSAEVSGCVDQAFNVSAATAVNYILSDTNKSCELDYWLEN